MKIWTFLILLLILSACIREMPIISRFDRMGEIVLDRDFVLGKWVLLDNAHILTAKHVVTSCQKQLDRCAFRNAMFWKNTFMTFSQNYDPLRDIIQVAIIPIPRDIPGIWLVPLEKNESIYIEHSGAEGRISGSILNPHVPYYAYTKSLSGYMLTGAMTDIIVREGESGTPVWNIKWELIGVMSAIDTEKWYGYIAY